MLVNKSINANATSKITVTTGDKENDAVVMTLSGNLRADGKYTISRSIENPELYASNKEQMEADEKEFETMLLSVAE